jgi:hypothetical protein
MSEHFEEKLIDLMDSLNDAHNILCDLERMSFDTEISDMMCHLTLTKNILTRYKEVVKKRVDEYL